MMDRAVDRRQMDRRFFQDPDHRQRGQAATVSDEDLTAAQKQFEDQLRSPGSRDASQPLLDRTRKTAAAADDYLRRNAWSAVAVAMAAGGLIGFLAAKH